MSSMKFEELCFNASKRVFENLAHDSKDMIEKLMCLSPRETRTGSGNQPRPVDNAGSLRNRNLSLQTRPSEMSPTIRGHKLQVPIL